MSVTNSGLLKDTAQNIKNHVDRILQRLYNLDKQIVDTEKELDRMYEEKQDLEGMFRDKMEKALDLLNV